MVDGLLVFSVIIDKPNAVQTIFPAIVSHTKHPPDLTSTKWRSSIVMHKANYGLGRNRNDSPVVHLFSKLGFQLHKSLTFFSHPCKNK